jgi:tetratricopeptide (TPR) repeat protein
MKRLECRGKSSFPILLAALLSTLFLLSACTSPEKAKKQHVSRGEALLKEQKFQEAAIEFRNAVQIDDQFAPARWGLARAYQGLQRGQEAFDELNRVVKLDPNNLEACVTLGNAYLVNIANSKDYLGMAEQLAKDVLQKDANNVEGHILMGGVLFAQKQGEKALDQLNRAIELNPARVDSYLSLARFYIITNELPKAEETYKRAIAVNGASALAHTEYGKFLVQSNRKSEAEAELRKAVEVEPTDRNSRFVLASYLQVTKQWDQAEAAYKSLADLDQDVPDGRAMLADYYSSMNRMDDAIRIYQELLTKSPDYLRGRYRLGEMMLMRGDSKGAMDQVDQLLKKDDHDRQALLLRARVKSQTGDPGDLNAAVEDLKEVLKQEPNSRLGLACMAQAMFSLGQFEQARNFAGELERGHPDYLPGKLIQVQLSQLMGDPKTALRLATDLLDRLSKSAPDRETSPQLLAGIASRVYVARGSARLKLEKPDTVGARQDFMAARDIAPNDTDAYINLAVVSLLEQKPDEAVGFYEKALTVDPASFGALSGLAGLYARQKQSDKARARIDQALGSNPNNASLHFLKAQILGIEQNQAGAEAELRKTLELDPNYTAAYAARGALFINTRQEDRAIAEYKKIVELKPDATAYTYIAMLEYERKNYDGAVDNYRKALQLDQNLAIAANNLAVLYTDFGKGNLDEALRLAQGVVQKHPRVAGYADTLGWAYYKKGLFANAIEQLQKAISLDEELAQKSQTNPSATYHYHLGAALAAKGDKVNARREMEQALRLGEKTPFGEADEARRTLSTL